MFLNTDEATMNRFKSCTTRTDQ